MSWMRALGSTGMKVSALGLGTVKLGRNSKVKYPGPFNLPNEQAARELLAQAKDLGVNLLDTAPAYGDSEERLGRLLVGQREHWLVCSKVGEEFDGDHSRFDFSPEHTRASVTRSLQRLKTDVLDIVLIHSDGEDLDILNDRGTLETLQQLKREGLIRAVGLSTKTVAGGIAAAPQCDVLMVTYNPQQQQDETVLSACAAQRCGALVKKALCSGHLGANSDVLIQDALRLALGHPGVSGAVVGTLSPVHLRENVLIAREVTA